MGVPLRAPVLPAPRSPKWRAMESRMEVATALGFALEGLAVWKVGEFAGESLG